MATVRTRKRGKTYSYIFEAGVNEKGKRKVIEKGGFATKAEAYEAGVTAYADWKHGNIGIVSERVTVHDFFTQWLNNVTSKSTKVTTLGKYQCAYRQRIAPYVGKMILQDVKPVHIERWIQQLFDNGYAHHTIDDARGLLASCFDYAIYPCELIHDNPVRKIKTPKNAPKHIIKRTVLDNSDLSALLNLPTIHNVYRIPMLLEYHTGMRISEVLGLSWDCIDFNNGTLVVRQQVQYLGKGRGYGLITPKTEASFRTIYLDSMILEELRQWRETQKAKAAELGDSYVVTYALPPDETLIEQSAIFPQPDNGTAIDFVCTRENGRLIKYTAYRQLLHKLNLNTHSFRYTHATQLLEAKAPLKDISSRLGHADISITGNLYAQPTEKMAKETVAIFEKEVLKHDKD